MTPTIIELRIQDTPPPDKDLAVTLRLQGQTLTQHTLGNGRFRELLAMADHFRHLFRRNVPAAMAKIAIDSTGIEMFDAWLAPAWPTLKTSVEGQHPVVLSLVSPLPIVLHLPWELLTPPNSPPWGKHPNRAIRRHSGSPVYPPQSYEALPQHPLRLLVLDSAEAPSSFQNLLQSIAAPLSAHIETAADINHLVQKIQQFKPSLVLLNGLSMVRSGQGFFLFADDSGQVDPKTGKEIVEYSLKNSAVRCLIVSGRNPEAPPPWSATALLADGIARAGIPLTIAWPDHLHTEPGRSFFKSFLEALACGTPVDTALHQGHDGLTDLPTGNNQPLWGLPWIFGSATNP